MAARPRGNRKRQGLGTGIGPGVRRLFPSIAAPGRVHPECLPDAGRARRSEPARQIQGRRPQSGRQLRHDARRVLSGCEGRSRHRLPRAAARRVPIQSPCRRNPPVRRLLLAVLLARRRCWRAQHDGRDPVPRRRHEPCPQAGDLRHHQAGRGGISSPLGLCQRLRAPRPGGVRPTALPAEGHDLLPRGQRGSDQAGARDLSSDGAGILGLLRAARAVRRGKPRRQVPRDCQGHGLPRPSRRSGRHGRQGPVP